MRNCITDDGEGSHGDLGCRSRVSRGNSERQDL